MAMMTQKELAFKAGVGIRTIRDIESGKVRPQPRTMRLLFKALGLNAANGRGANESDRGGATRAAADRRRFRRP
jgi:transcriptional regulator with XRE-family HTH domain